MYKKKYNESYCNVNCQVGSVKFVHAVVYVYMIIFLLDFKSANIYGIPF